MKKESVSSEEEDGSVVNSDLARELQRIQGGGMSEIGEEEQDELEESENDINYNFNENEA